MVLVTGGAGYIGSHTCVELLNAGYEVLVADNLYNSCEEPLRRVEKICGKPVRFCHIDVCSEEDTDRLFRENPGISAVIHFAAYKAVGESVQKPLDYYSNNLRSTLSVLQAMRRYGVNSFVFSSSATVYGQPASVPVREDFPGTVTSPYAATKLFIETMLKDHCAANAAFNAAILRYFNPIGAHPCGLIGEDPEGIPNNLVPYIAQVAVGKLRNVSVYGNDYPTADGTGVRDYIHVVDLAQGHVAALKKLATGCGLLVCNLGTGRGYSVLEVIAAYERACGRPIPFHIAPRRAGDVAEYYADPSVAQRELGWRASYGLDEMCAHSWRWQSQNPGGYKDT